MITTPNRTIAPQFPLGRTLATPGAFDALEQSGESPALFLRRHASGDWGDLGDEDKTLNDQAVSDGGRILSSYITKTGVKLWIISEAADEEGTRTATTLLLPSEY
jgi:hypothetical protein